MRKHSEDLLAAINSLSALERRLRGKLRVCVLDRSEVCHGYAAKALLAACCQLANEGYPDILVEYTRKRSASRKCVVVELKTCLSGKFKNLRKAFRGVCEKIENARQPLSSHGCASVSSVLVLPKEVRCKLRGVRAFCKSITEVADPEGLPDVVRALIKDPGPRRGGFA